MTIVDIAREAGYSVSTVSRVLNGRRDVSPEAREKILAIVNARHFVPNKNAKHLKQTVSQSIILLVKGTSNMLFADVIEALENTVGKSAHSLRVHYLDEDANEVRAAIRMCREQKPMGILFLGGNVQNFSEEFRQVTVPCVLVTDRGDELGFDNLSSVSTDDVAAAEKAVDYLLEHGHRYIGVIGGDMGLSSPSSRRRTGCIQSFAKYGCTFDERYYATARFSYDSAYRAMNHLLEQKLPITAVFAMSDVMAIGAMRAIFDAGLRVPEDISVIGFDGTLLADYYNPKIVTICQGYEEIARRSVQILLDMMEQNQQAVHELVPFTLKNTQSVISR
jgi:LacI family transcriptional regulator